MAKDQLALTRAAALLKRELRTSGFWGLAVLSMAYGIWNVSPGSFGPDPGEGFGSLEFGPLSFSSWINALGLILTVMIPLWIMERVPRDHGGGWFDSLWVRGWSRDSYLLSLYAVVVGIGSAIFLITVLVAWVFSFVTGVSMPPHAFSMALAGVPTFLAFGAGGLLLGTLFRDRGLAMSVAILGIVVPVAISGVFFFKLDQPLPEFLRTLFSFHIPPPHLDLSIPRILHKMAYASVTLWLSLVLGGGLLGRRP